MLLGVIIVVSLAIGLAACGNAQQQRGNTNVIERWEYKVVRPHGVWSDHGDWISNAHAEFNVLGRDGWKYAGGFMFYNPPRHIQYIVFKRRLP